MTFTEFTSPKKGYLAYVLSPNSREEILRKFKPKYSEVIAHHVTVKFPAKSTEDLPPATHTAHVVGYEDSGDGLEALVVEINGHMKRPDGKLYHITLSLDRHAGKKPVHSNDLLSNGFQPVHPFPIHLTPSFQL